MIQDSDLAARLGGAGERDAKRLAAPIIARTCAALFDDLCATARH
ncbi:MAG: hypothetical protein OXF51_10780 [Alphaproteobacteria bacterium]|nr:hypothetical protein [Alphaproteobacteria bacterium]